MAKSSLIIRVQNEIIDELRLYSHAANLLYAKRKENDLTDLLQYIQRMHALVKERNRLSNQTLILE